MAFVCEKLYLLHLHCEFHLLQISLGVTFQQDCFVQFSSAADILSANNEICDNLLLCFILEAACSSGRSTGLCHLPVLRPWASHVTLCVLLLNLYHSPWHQIVIEYNGNRTIHKFPPCQEEEFQLEARGLSFTKQYPSH